ncbi:hypothetical protein GCM10009712_33790 [Pseudarthrobacter sulfonivorans]|uniref:Tc toxin subunit A-related protein n=1 Tax=Pseudarthrobacter sulfonivorans TaxID=121292 RepID=UPI00168BEF25|nr:hypothetical protein [Pseudarthrobacter sulfonivorans]
MVTFPENDVQVFRGYPAVKVLVKSGARISQKLAEATNPDVSKELGVDKARRVRRARGRLRKFLANPALSIVQLDESGEELLCPLEGKGVYELIEQRDFVLALKQLKKLIGTVDEAMDRETIDLALKREAIAFSFEGPVGNPPPGSDPELVLKHGVLPGYSGPDLSTKERRRLAEYSQLLVEGTERIFWLNTLRAECHLGLNDPASALELYESILADREIDEVRRKFVAIRAAHANLRLGDQTYRSERKLGSATRARARGSYDAAMAVVRDAGVSGANPLAAEITSRSKLQLIKLNANLNILGYRDSLVPVQRHTGLQNLALQDIDLARGAVEKAVTFRSRADDLAVESARLKEEEDAAEKTIQIAVQREASARDQVGRVDVAADILSQQQDLFSTSSTISMGGAAMSGAIAGAAAGPVGAAVGAAVGVATGVIGKLARSEEIALQQRSVALDRKIAERDLVIAGLEAQIAAARLNFIADRREVLAGQVLNEDLFYTLARIYEDLARSYLDHAILVAYLFERAAAYFLGAPEMRIVRFDYEAGPGGFIAAPDELLQDIQSIVEKVALDSLKTDRFVDQISLREAFPLEFSRFQQTGQLNAVLSRYELDKRRPGSSWGRLNDVSVELNGLVPATGITGHITHMGQFMLRDATATMLPETVRLIPTEAELDAALSAQESGDAAAAAVGGIVVCNFDSNTKELDGEFTSSETGSSIKLGLTEGYGPAAMWRLVLEPEVARNLTDVVLHLDTQAFASDPFGLGPKVQALIASYEAELEPESGGGLDRFLAISLRRHVPDVFLGLKKSTGSIQISEAMVGGATQRVKAVIAQALDANGVGVPGVEIEIGSPDRSLIQVRTTGGGGFTENLDEPINMVPQSERPIAAGAWTIQLPLPAQLDLLDDLMLLILHEIR